MSWKVRLGYHGSKPAVDIELATADDAMRWLDAAITRNDSGATTLHIVAPDGRELSLNEAYLERFGEAPERAGERYCYPWLKRPRKRRIDTSDIPEAGEAFFKTARLVVPPFIPPSVQGTIALLEARGHKVTVRRNRNGSNRYTLDSERERTAHELEKRRLRLYGAASSSTSYSFGGGK